MNIDLSRLEWRPAPSGPRPSPAAHAELRDGTLSLRNDEKDAVEFVAQRKVTVDDESHRWARIVFRCTDAASTGAVLLMNGEPLVPADSEVATPFGRHATLEFRIRLRGGAQVNVLEATCTTSAEPANILETFQSTADVLVVTPAYPTADNLYLCGFVHARLKEYVRQGLSVDVASISPAYGSPTVYTIEGVRVLRGAHQQLKSLLERRQYKTVVVHFVDEHLLQLFDGYVRHEQLVFICHGPETVFEYLPNKTRPYFVPEQLPSVEQQREYAIKRRYVSRYAQKDNVTWVFVSDWLRKFSEEQLGFTFKNAVVIHNLINEKVFPFRQKTAEHRKKILVIRKFDDISQHSIDQVVFAIRELSRRDFFSELRFSIYGQGPQFEALLAPLRGFSNIELKKTFLTHEQISAVHAEHGIALLPSRHDAHAVSMSEAASSGLVVVGSRVTSNPDFMNEAENHTLADPEDPLELANVLERLYRQPDEFLAISKRMADDVRARCNTDETAGKEIALIRRVAQRTAQADGMPPRTAPKQARPEPLLTIAVPAYNVERYIDKCLWTLLDHDRLDGLEVLVVDDGSKDATNAKAQRYVERFPSVVRVVRQVNAGHGGAINTALKEARGRYIRLVDGDDWVDSSLLAEQLRRLETETADVVLTTSSFEFIDGTGLTDGVRYDALREGTLYHVDDLLFPKYGFDQNGPLLPTGTYRTQCLRDANFSIELKCAYVDQEWNAYSLLAAKTLRYYRLDIYRYLMGRAGQTVSREAWKTKYTDHLKVVLKLARFVSTSSLTPLRRRYVMDRIVAPLIDTQIFLFDFVSDWDGLSGFLDQLQAFPEVYEAGLKNVKDKNGDSLRILLQYRLRFPWKVSQLPGIGAAQWRSRLPAVPSGRKALKALVPYGVVRLYQKRNRG